MQFNPQPALRIIGLATLVYRWRWRSASTGIDIKQHRIDERRAGRDATLDVDAAELVYQMAAATVYIVTIDTPVDQFGGPT